jgi:hypothetical protein
MYVTSQYRACHFQMTSLRLISSWFRLFVKWKRDCGEVTHGQTPQRATVTSLALSFLFRVDSSFLFSMHYIEPYCNSELLGYYCATCEHVNVLWH